MNIFHRTIKGNNPTPSEFARGVYIEPVYVELRVRGFSRFDSFVASFGEAFAGRPSDIEDCCLALEEAERYKEEFREAISKYQPSELVAIWDEHATLPEQKAGILSRAKRKLGIAPSTGEKVTTAANAIREKVAIIEAKAAENVTPVRTDPNEHPLDFHNRRSNEEARQHHEAQQQYVNDYYDPTKTLRLAESFIPQK